LAICIWLGALPTGAFASELDDSAYFDGHTYDWDYDHGYDHGSDYDHDNDDTCDYDCAYDYGYEPVDEVPPLSASTPSVVGLPFLDLEAGHWAIPAIRYVYEQGLMQGTSAISFAPYAPLDRAMVATIIHRLAGEPAHGFRPIFHDVQAGAWYAIPAVWAHDAGIVQGVGDRRFAPERSITREELAAMFFRWADGQGYDMYVPRDMQNPFTDLASVSDWAVDYVRWAVHHGLITPTTTGGSQLDPGGRASRAETAMFLARFTGGVPPGPIVSARGRRGALAPVCVGLFHLSGAGFLRRADCKL